MANALISVNINQGRGGMGIIDIQTGERNGKAVGVLQGEQSDRVMLITNAGQVIKIPVANIANAIETQKVSDA